MEIRSIDIAAFDYDLPAGRIAVHPVQPRDHSRLLVYQNGKIQESRFFNLANELDEQIQLCVNDSRVIPARLKFQKPSGGIIEIFCLEPSSRHCDVSTALSQRGEVYWHCLIGGASKWKKGMELTLPLSDDDSNRCLHASFVEKGETDFMVRFHWPESIGSFGEVLEWAGRIPLPPYIKRSVDEQDKSDYQTAFAQFDGSVAAPTAGLHFTNEVLETLDQKGIERLALTLHVGAGTFKPVTAARLEDHAMHGEWIHVQRRTLQHLLNHRGKRVAVGTTVLRTLETIYWLGARVHRHPEASLDKLSQWEPYELEQTVPVATALQALIDRMDRDGVDSIWTKTELLIAPGYSIRMADGLITNFHQPRSTLLLLVSAFVGADWRKIYQYAMENDFRFLSYGDSSLLWKNDDLPLTVG
jgi:S-adenosylmethionine:tRNA ribosyltransferase-isomerase